MTGLNLPAGLLAKSADMQEVCKMSPSTKDPYTKKSFGNQVLVHIVKAPKGSGTGFGMSRPDGYDVYTNQDERSFHKLKVKN